MADQDRDLWDEFDATKPAASDRVPGYPGGEPHGFGFRTGVRSAAVALGSAVYTLVLGTALTITGAIVFMAQDQWLLVGLMALIETVFVLSFIVLARQARRRRG